MRILRESWVSRWWVSLPVEKEESDFGRGNYVESFSPVRNARKAVVAGEEDC